MALKISEILAWTHEQLKEMSFQRPNLIRLHFEFMVAISANYFDNVAIALIPWIIPLLDFCFNSFKLCLESLNCFYLPQASVQVDLILSKHRHAVNQFKWVKLCLEIFELSLAQIFFFVIFECETRIICFWEGFVIFLLGFILLPQFHDDVLCINCHFQIIFMVNWSLFPEFVHERMHQLWGPEFFRIWKFLKIWNGKVVFLLVRGDFHFLEIFL